MSKNSEDSAYLQFALYITSGIFIIFMMENILKIGMQYKN
jgi:hypothetical protein